MSRTEALEVDPQQLLVLEAAYSVLHAASPSDEHPHFRDALRNSPIGVYLGIFGATLARLGGHAPGHSNAVMKKMTVYSGTSSSIAIASGRISYALGLTGPCLPVDTACSASLVALHLARTALEATRECDRACVIGVNMLDHGTHVAFSTAGMLSDHGRCHTFDSRADGYCRAEGCAAFVLDHQTHLRWSPQVVRCTSVMQDGPSASLTAPNGSQQR
ncbi:beta-ketoacyl synthase, partial [Pelagophyceae sp. CCMP2097]